MVGLDYFVMFIDAGLFTVIAITVVIVLFFVLKALFTENKHVRRIPFWVLLGFYFLVTLDVIITLPYKEYNSVCRDSKILNLLKNDETTPEFVLDGKYYVLPCELKNFIDDGWTITRTKEGQRTDIENIALKDSGYAMFTIATPYGELSLVVDVSDRREQGIRNVMVIGAFYTSNKHRKELYRLPNPNYFVTKNGLTENTEFQQARELTSEVSTKVLYVMERDQTEPMAPNIFGNCYDLLTERITSEIYDLTKSRWYKGRITYEYYGNEIIPIEKRFPLEKANQVISFPISFNGVRLIALLLLTVFVSLIVLSVLFSKKKRKKSDQSYMAKGNRL